MKKALNAHMAVLQFFVFAVFWATLQTTTFPTLGTTLGALLKLWKEGLLHEVFTSMGLYFTSLSISAVVALAISGATALPVVKDIDIGNIFKPFAELCAKVRYMSLVGFVTVFQILTPDMFWLKVSILIFGIAPWFITSLNNIIESTPSSKTDYARTLRFSEWKVAFEVKIWGNRDKAIEAFRQSAAMGFMMLTVAEKLSKDSGGIGVLLAGDEKFHNMGSIFAVQIFVLLAIGAFQDVIIRGVREIMCPYAIIAEGKKNGQ